MWFEEHLPSLLALVATVVFIVRLEARDRERDKWQEEHAVKMSNGFSAITSRLDIQNGRIQKLELERAYEKGREDAVAGVEH